MVMPGRAGFNEMDAGQDFDFGPSACHDLKQPSFLQVDLLFQRTAFHSRG